MGTKSKWLKGKLTFYNNAVVEQNVSTSYTSTNATMPPYGLRVLDPTGTAKMIINAAPAVGAELQLVNISTNVCIVRVSTAAGGVEILSNCGASTKYYGVGLNAATQLKGHMPGCVTLRGVTTAVWAVVGTALSSGGTTGGGHYLSTSFA